MKLRYALALTPLLLAAGCSDEQPSAQGQEFSDQETETQEQARTANIRWEIYSVNFTADGMMAMTGHNIKTWDNQDEFIVIQDWEIPVSEIAHYSCNTVKQWEDRLGKDKDADIWLEEDAAFAVAEYFDLFQPSRERPIPTFGPPNGPQ